MKAESVAFAVAGMCFGVILGWVLASQDAGRTQQFTQPPQAQAAAPAPANQPPPPPPLDAERVRALQSAIERNPRDAASLAQLGNAYFDAEHWTEAIDAYTRSLAIEPDNADISTDLGVSYYSTNRVDEALAQFEHSLKVSPNHTKTLFNKGIVLAFGKENLDAATDAWKKLVEVAPDTPEGQQARRFLENVAAAHAQQGSTTNQ
jgi:cytochrome c-type biogenesis protein CcmH/NrfG